MLLLGVLMYLIGYIMQCCDQNVVFVLKVCPLVRRNLYNFEGGCCQSGRLQIAVVMVGLSCWAKKKVKRFTM